jgi:hypothetical protein
MSTKKSMSIIQHIITYIIFGQSNLHNPDFIDRATIQELLQYKKYGANSLRKVHNIPVYRQQKEELIYKNGGTKFPDFKALRTKSELLNIITFTRSLSQKRNKRTSGLLSFFKPFRNMTMTNPYEYKKFYFNPELPISNYLANNNMGVDYFDKNNDEFSESSENMYRYGGYLSRGGQQYEKQSEMGVEISTKKLIRADIFL